MKNILKYILCFAFCVGVICATTTTVNAEEFIYATDLEVGDTFYYDVSCADLHNGVLYEHYLNATWEVTSGNIRNCLYLNSNGLLYLYSGGGVEPLAGVTWYTKNTVNGNVNSFTNQTFINIKPVEYGYDADYTNYFRTNIPIFPSQDMAIQYVNGEIDIKSALNYKKSFENGSWVKPFEDIEINDSNMSSPQLANVSHSGFTVVNVPDERYMVDVYLESGIQNPLPYEISLTSIGDALFVNSFGLVSDTEGAFTGEIDLLSCYGVDNVSALNESVSQFYSTYPSINAFNDSLLMDTLKVNKPTWSIWGQPFGKSFVFFSKSTSATGTVSADNCPLAYTNYKVRYFYYDDDSGFHYGPWTNFIYFSDGRVMRGEVFQGNDGNIIESPLESGTQDSSGNVSMNYGSLVDIENPNELFGYLRSLINNINATGNIFMTLFGTVFSFLPSDLLAIIWLGIGCMILIGIIRAFN